MESFADVIAKFPDGVLASGLRDAKGDPIGSAAIALWKHRKSIPSEYWTQVVALAKPRRLGITADLLIEIAAKRKRAA